MLKGSIKNELWHFPGSARNGPLVLGMWRNYIITVLSNNFLQNAKLFGGVSQQTTAHKSIRVHTILFHWGWRGLPLHLHPDLVILHHQFHIKMYKTFCHTHPIYLHNFTLSILSHHAQNLTQQDPNSTCLMMCLKKIISLGSHNVRGVIPITPALKLEKTDLELKQFLLASNP